MKKIILTLVFIAIIITSCTEQTRARHYGGDAIIRLQPGEKLIEATYKDDDIWYLVEPMEDDYIPKTKIFKESSSLGILEGTVTFIETR